MVSSPEVLNTADLETRIVAADSYAIGKAPGPRALVHTQLRVLFGQSPEAKRDLSDRIASVLRGLAPRPNGVLMQLSVELVDMDRGSYTKERLGGVVGS